MNNFNYITNVGNDSLYILVVIALISVLYTLYYLLDHESIMFLLMYNPL